MDPAAQRFAALINRPASDRHLDLLCALVGQAIDPDAEVATVIAGLDRLADSCPATFDGIIDTLFASGMLSGDGDDYHHLDNSLMHRVLERRLGMPITLSVVAIEVGKRLGVPIVGVGLPGHFVVRSNESGTFADPFGRGVRYDAAGMLESWQRRMTSGGRLDRAALGPTPSRDIVLRILNNLKHSLVSGNDPVRLSRLVPLRAAFPELAGERSEHRRWMRHFN
jgi:regulator of sirC expression with transglutaminase-like and TPR domain